MGNNKRRGSASDEYPGWAWMLFGLGIFASARLLPRAIVGVAVFYLLAGTLNLALSAGNLAFDPWSMGVPFGFGQLVTAVILYWNLERDRAQ